MVDWDGEGYEQISDLQRWLAGRALATMRLRGDERVLDVGCGDGYVSRLRAAERWRAAFDGFPVPFVHVDPQTYPELAASAGLSVSTLNVDDLEWDFGSREAFSRWCTCLLYTSDAADAG